MGKIVKFCGSCDEGFAEKFGFCPNCGATLQAFEMNPVEAAKAAPIEAAAEAAPATREIAAAFPPAPEFIAAPVTAEVASPFVEAPAPVTAEFAAPAEEPIIEEPVVEAAAIEAASEPEIIQEIEEPVVEVAKPAAVAAAAPIYIQKNAVDVDQKPVSLEAEHDKALSEGGFYITVIEEKNVRQRNLLLVGALGFMLFSLMSATLYNLFSKDLEVGSISDDIFNAVIVDDVPMTVEEEKQVKENKDAGGGGGGGRDEKDPVNRGDLADQTPDPIRPPDVKIPKLDDPALRLPPASTKGNMKFDKTYGQIGDPNSSSDALSNGPGTGGGVGSGRGTGQGSGNGLGAGSGDGSGYGNGNGNGNGDGTGDGTGGGPPPQIARGVTQGIKILSKPRPGYTDAARQANIQGTVILRVTFLGSGQIGSISPVKGLGNGLTEQAIAAARRISFEPAKTNGIGQTVTKQIEYTFSIY